MAFEAHFLFECLWGASLAVRKDHVTWFFPFPAAVFHVQAEIVLQDIVVFRKSQLLGRSIDRCGGPLQFHKRSDRCFVEFNQETLGPVFRIWQAKSGAVLFITEPAAHPQSLENLGQIPGVSDLHLDLLSDFVWPIGYTLHL